MDEIMLGILCLFGVLFLCAVPLLLGLLLWRLGGLAERLERVERLLSRTVNRAEEAPALPPKVLMPATKAEAVATILENPVRPPAPSAPPSLPSAPATPSAPAKEDLRAPFVPSMLSAPRPPPPLQPPSEIEAKFQAVLQRFWNWLVVGEEYRKPGVSAEYAIATAWLPRGLFLISLFAVGCFLKYSIDKGFFRPEFRVAACYLAGAGLLVGGIKILGRRYGALGITLLGIGIGTLYFASFSATSLYDPPVFPTWLGFATMSLVTLTAGILAARCSSLVLAIFGIAGGYLTPVLIQTGIVNLPGLYSYLLLLGVGVLYLSYKKDWPLLNLLSLFCTYGLYITALAKADSQLLLPTHAAVEPGEFAVRFGFLIAFFVLFTFTTIIRQLLGHQKSTLLELLVLLFNASLVFGLGVCLLVSQYDRATAAWLPAAMAAAYVGLLLFFLRQKREDRLLSVTLMALPALFLGLVPPLAIGFDTGLGTTWSLEALALLWVSTQVGSRTLRTFSYILYALAIAMVCRYEFSDITLSVAKEDYWRLLLDRLFSIGIPIAALAASWKLLSKPVPPDVCLFSGNDLPEELPDSRNTMLWILPLAGLGLFIVLGTIEVHGFFHCFWSAGTLVAVSAFWGLIAAALLLLAGARRPNFQPWLVLGLGLVLLVKIGAYDWIRWDFASDIGAYFSASVCHWQEKTLHVEHALYWRDAGLRLLDLALLAGFFWLGWRQLRSRTDQDSRMAGLGCGILVLGLLLVWATLETSSGFYIYRPALQKIAVSVLWALFALGWLGGGLAKSLQALRLAGLALFAIVGAKVIFFDLQGVELLWRALALLLIALCYGGGAFLYLKFQERFATAGDDGRPIPPPPEGLR